MKLIDKLVFKDLIGPFLFGLMTFMILVFTAGFLFQATDMLVKGIPLILVLKFILYALPSIVTQTFPMAMLLAALMGLGRLSSDREAVAIFAAGVSFPRAARAVLLMGVVVSGIAYLWNETVVPPATTAMWNLKQDAMSQIGKSDRPLSYSVMGKDGMTVEEFVKIDRGYDAPTHTIRGVTILKFGTTGAHRGQTLAEIYCDHAVVADQRGLNWTYYDPTVTVKVWDAKTGLQEPNNPIHTDVLQTLPNGATVGKTFNEVVNSEVTDSNRKSFRQLRADIIVDRAKGHDAEAMSKEVDLYGKLALPLASVIFGIVGAALGLNTQRGGSKAVGFGMAIFIVFLYWVFYHAMFVAGSKGALPPMLASFAADIVGALVGIVLAVRASR